MSAPVTTTGPAADVAAAQFRHDHEIVIGRVRDVAAGRADDAPLLFWRGRYARMEP